MLSALIAAVMAISHDDPQNYKPPPKPKVFRSYATCYQLSGTTASGVPVGPGVAAHNFLRSGTRFRLVGKTTGPGGRRKYVVRDTGPALADGHFDLWAPGGCIAWGKHSIRYKLGWKPMP